MKIIVVTNLQQQKTFFPMVFRILFPSQVKALSFRKKPSELNDRGKMKKCGHVNDSKHHNKCTGE